MKCYIAYNSFTVLLLQVENCDLLAPTTGELVGGSLRERNPDALRSRGCKSSLNWYVELRNAGHPSSAGFGLGMERFMQTLFGIKNIKDTVAFPRYYMGSYF